MDSRPLSVGDILMLSQTAWKISRAFTQCKRVAPVEFAEVEREANRLSEALKQVAEALHTDGSILSEAEPQTRRAVNTILESAHRTLNDLESFVERYQVIKKKETHGGFMVERSWSDVVLANYKSFKWTTEGGDITELRNMLQMHTNTINLTMQALQTRSLDRIERTVMPMAENIADIHVQPRGELGDKIDELHRIIMAVANSTPSLSARDRAISTANSIRSSTSTVSTLEQQHPGTRPMLELPPPRSSSYNQPTRHVDDRVWREPSKAAVAGAARQAREDSAYYSMGPLPFERDGRRMDWGFESGSPPDQRDSFGDGEYEESAARHVNSVRPWNTTNASPRALASAMPVTRRESNIARRESSTLPSMFKAIEAIDETIPEDSSSQYEAYYTNVSPTAHEPPPRIDTSHLSNGQTVLPPPAIAPDSSPDSMRSPATPLTYFSSPKRSRSKMSQAAPSPRPSTAKSGKPRRTERHDPVGGSSPETVNVSFEKALVRNAAILCDVRATLVEYAQHIPDEPDPRYNTEMVAACKESRICVIRKRENREHGGTRVVTSVWSISDDGAVRMQQKLSDINETVPYCSYFQPEKVSLPPTEGETTLRFHDEQWGAMLQSEKRTNWVNYLFADESDATAFQSAIFGRTLLGSYRTTKTTVIHEGLKGAFAFEEQFANIEMLRLWEDDGICTPGGGGGVLALMHMSSNFGDGWARWWINSSKQQVRVKEDGGKYVKVKGIDISTRTPGSGASTADKIRSPATAGEGLQRSDASSIINAPRPQGRRIPVKRVTGVRIEFKAEEERAKFVSLAKRCQERMIPLPDA